ncbi:MAG: Ig-like domain-containing protein, partial [Acidobacteriota bacterium]
MTPSRLVRIATVVVSLATASLAGAATTQFRVFFDTDRNSTTGCTVGGMTGVEQVLTTQVADALPGGSPRVTSTQRQLCTGIALGAPIDVDASGWPAAFEPTARELTFETRIRLSAFGANGIPQDLRLGYETTRGTATHTVLLDGDSSDIIIPARPVRRRAVGSPGTPRAIVLDGLLGDWQELDSTVYGIASDGTQALRVLRVFSWFDPGVPVGEKYLYFAVVARLSSDMPYADDDIFTRHKGESLAVAGPGVLQNDGDPFGLGLQAVKVTDPERGSVTLNQDGSFTYSPNHPQSMTPDEFEYKVKAQDNRESNVARVEIRVTDEEGDDEPASFTAGGDVTVEEDSGLYSATWATAITGNAADLTFNVTNDNTSLFYQQPAISPSGVLTFDPNTNANGSAIVTVTLTSPGGTTSPVTFTITVTPVNDAPTFTKGPNQSVAEDSGPQVVSPWATSISPGPADEAGQTVFFSVSGNTNPSLFSVAPAVSPTGVLTYTPAPDANGTATLTLVLTDNGVPPETSVPRTFTITITPVNDNPSFTAGGDVTVNEDSGAYSATWATNISAGPLEPTQTVNFVVTNDNNALFTGGGQPAIAPNGTLTFTPAVNASGSAVVSVTLFDSLGGSSAPAVTFTINVTAINDAPSFVKGADQAVSEDAGAQIVNPWATAISPGPADESGQTVAFTVTNNTNPSLFLLGPSIDPSGVLTYTPAADANGVATITISLTDNGVPPATSATQTFTITVNPVNDAPSFAAGPDQVVNEDAGLQTVANWATAISPGPANESAQTVSFVIDSNTNSALFSQQPAVASNGTLTYTPAANANGSATITLHAFDDGGAPGVDVSPTQSFMITVNAINDPPTFTLGGNQSVNEDAGLQTVPGFASAIVVGPADESAQTVTFNVSNDNNALFTGGGQPAIAPDGTLTYTPAADAFGSATVTVSATDSGGATSSPSQTFTITINAINDEPSFSIAGDPAASNEDAGPQTVNGFATAVSAGPANESAQTLTFTLTPTGTTGGLTFSGAPAIDASGNLTYTASPNANGTASFSVVLTDSGLGAPPPNDNTSATATFTITVTAVNDPPSFNLGSNQVVNEDAGLQTVNGFASAISVGPANESAQTITSFNVTNDNNALFTGGGQPAIDTAGNLTYTPSPNAFGSATVSVTATDSGGATSSPAQTFTITVNPINDAPVVTAGGTLSYTENQGPTAVDGALTVTDVDSANLTGATIQITGNYLNGEDVLSFVDTANITGNFVAGTGTLTLSGSDTVANYQTALRNVLYNNTSDNPSTATRTVSWQVNDGAGVNNLSTTVTSTINIAPVNDAPVLTAGATLTYTEGDPATALDTTVTVNDADSANITGATVQITGNYVNGEDVLSFATLGPISGSFAPATGTMTLSGTDTLANYQAALRTVKYNNTATSPSTLQRTVTWIATDGVTPSSGVTSFINVVSINTAPTVTAGATLSYTENQVATAIDTTITVTDPDTANMASATVQITGNYVNGEDVLGFTTQNGINGVFTPASGLLTLTGSSSTANYQTALRSVTYVNTSDNPSVLARTVSWRVDDGDATNNLSNIATSTINVAAVNDAPVLTAGATLNYTENQVATAIDTTITATDADNTNLTGATVQITGNYANGQDVLSFATIGAISGSFAAGSGTLTLTGTDTVANYQAALRTVKYANTSENPSVAARTVTWIATDGVTPSSGVTSTINVSSVNDAPVLTAGATLNYTENAPATVIDNTITATDADHTNLTGATVQITGNYVNGEDVLSFATLGPISGSFAPATGTLTLTGTDTVANYQAALRTVKYANTSENPSVAARTVTWIATDGVTPSTGVTSTINVIAVNDPPAVNAVAVVGYTEDAGAVVLDNTITVTDPDDATLTGASVQITTNYVNGQDVLAFTNAFGITGNFVAATGTLNLTGAVSPANYQSALRTVTYQNTSNSPSPAPRTIVWTASDDEPSSGTDSTTLNVTSVNDNPVITAGATLNYTENDPATVIDNTITVADVDSPTLASATVQITGNYANGQDVLSFATIGPISGSFVAGTGTLTLTGPDTVANYQAALRTVKYANTSEGPSTLARTVSWQVNDGAGVNNLSNVATSTINVAAVNDPPVINAAASLGYTEDAGPVAIDAALTVTDVDDALLPSATVQITANYVNGQDILAFTNAFGITGNFVAGSGTLTLTGPASPANFESALRTVTYQNTSNNPSVAPRTVTWTVNDDEPSSGTDTTTINVTATNDAPVLSVSGNLTYTENDAATSAITSATITDADDVNIESATIQITGNYQNGQDVLSFANTANITGVWTVGTGLLTLTGSDTLAAYQTALQNVKYNNTSEAPSVLQRTVTWRVNDGDVNSNGPTSTIDVINVNDAPVVNAGAVTLNYTENDPATAINTSLTVSDIDNANLTGATIQITGNYINGQDVLSYVNVAPISGSFVAATGTMTLTGTTTVANYQTALRSIKYNNTSENPSQALRTVTWQVNDGQALNNLSTPVTSNINVIAVNDAPSIAGETFEALGNTELQVDYTPGTTTPKTSETTAGASSYLGVLDNDSDVEGDPFAVTAITGCGDVTAPFDCTISGAVIHVEANGQFSFTPAPGATSGSFSYTATDTPVVGTAASAGGTVSFTLFDMIWYVQQGASGNGTSLSPLGSFATLNGAGGAGDIDGPSDFIFVHNGASLTSNIELEANQHLIGEGVGLFINRNLNGNGAPTTLVVAGTRPPITSATDTVKVTAAMPVEIQGLNLSSTGGNAIDLTATGAYSGSSTLTIGTITFGSTTAESIDVNAGATGTLGLSIIVQNWTGTASANAIDVRTTAGTVNLALNTLTGVNSTATGVFVDGSGGGTLNITTFAGISVDGNTGGTGVSVNTARFDQVVGGAYDVVNAGTHTIGASGNGVGTSGMVLTNVTGDLNFSDLNIFNSAGTGLFLTSTGSANIAAGTGMRLVVTANSGDITAAGGPAVSVNNATVDLQLGTMSSSSTPTSGVSLTSVSDSTVSNARFSAPAGSTITTTAGATGPIFNVSGGNAGISYAGTIVNTSASARAISVVSWAGDDATDDMTFSGAIDENGAGILFNTNAGSRSVTFSGGLDIDTITGEGFAATSNTFASLTITGTNDITSTSATALRVTSTTIGAGHLTFRNISSGNNTAAADP